MLVNVYFKIFPYILSVFSVIGLINVIENFPNALIGGGLITFITMSFSMVLVSNIKTANPPQWYLKITKIIPIYLLGVLLLLLAIINSTVTLPVYLGNLPLGLINSLTLSFFIGGILIYETIHKTQVLMLKITISIYMIISLILIFSPAIKIILTGY